MNDSLQEELTKSKEIAPCMVLSHTHKRDGDTYLH